LVVYVVHQHPLVTALLVEHHLLHVPVGVRLVQVLNSPLNHALKTGSTLLVLVVAALGAAYRIVHFGKWAHSRSLGLVVCAR